MKTLMLNPQSLPFMKLKAWGVKPLVLDFYVQQVWPTFSLERVFARVIGKRSETPQTVSLVLKPNFNFRNFQAGQHILLTITVNGHRFTRSYSPTLIGKRQLEITVKNVPGGKVSSQICGAFKIGTIVEISQPFGDMTWERLPAASHYTFCAAGVGITPLRSLIQAWAKADALNKTIQIDLHYWAQTEEELCFQDELLKIAQLNPGLKVKLYATRIHSPSAGSAKVNGSLFSDKETVFVACGPEGFVMKTEQIAQQMGAGFYGEHAQSAKVDENANLKAETFFELTYEGQVIQASSSKTILETLEDNGLKPVHGCRMGICKSCTCLKTSGVSVNTKNQTISNEQNEEIQICVSKPRSAMTVRGY